MKFELITSSEIICKKNLDLIGSLKQLGFNLIDRNGYFYSVDHNQGLFIEIESLGDLMKLIKDCGGINLVINNKRIEIYNDFRE